MRAFMFNLRFKPNALTASLFALIAMASSVCLSADPASSNDLDKIVVIEGASPRGTGFITIFQDKMAVVSAQKVLNTKNDLKLKDINGESLSYTSIFIPEDKRGIVVFELAPEEKKRTFLPLEEDVSENCGLDSNVTVYGYKKNIRAVTRAKGRVLAIGPELLDLSVKTSGLLAGGPVISKSSHRAVAVFSSARTQDGKNSLLGIRIDTVEKLVKFDKEILNKELRAISRINDFVSALEAKKLEYAGKISEFKIRVENFKKISGGEVNVMKASMERTSKTFLKKVRSVIPENGWSLAFVKDRYDEELKKAAKVLNSFKELKSELDEVYRKSNQIK